MPVQSEANIFESREAMFELPVIVVAGIFYSICLFKKVADTLAKKYLPLKHDNANTYVLFEKLIFTLGEP